MHLTNNACSLNRVNAISLILRRNTSLQCNIAQKLLLLRDYGHSVFDMNSDLLKSLWDDAKAKTLDEPGLLLYRSNLLGADLRITNFGGGNTSAKVKQQDPLTGEEVEVLWVKGSGGDIGSMQLDGFATLYMDKLLSLKGLYKNRDQEDAMVHALNHCTFNLNPRAPSIDTCLHGYVPQVHPCQSEWRRWQLGC